MNRAGTALTSRHNWRRLTYELTVSTSTTTIYALPSDLYEIVNNTVWSRDENEMAFGPMHEQDWQYQKAIEATGRLVPEWRLGYTHGVPSLELMDAPGAVQVWVLEYRSKNWVINTSTSATAALWSAESERTTLDEDLFLTELSWRWLKAKGLPYAEEFEEAQRQIEVEIARDKGGSKALHLTGGEPPIIVLSSVGL